MTEREPKFIDKESRREAILKELNELQFPNVGTDQDYSAEERAGRIRALEQELLEIDPINPAV